MTQPVIYMIAGPNGAGKTTAALQLLPNFLSVYEFVNADEIGRGLNPLNPEGQAITSGKLMLQRMEDLIAARVNFAFETTGSSLTFIKKLERAKAQGYRVGLVYLWLPLVGFAKFRVRMRVAQGGHSIPDEDIERRYKRGLLNIWHYYWSLADQASIFDSTLPGAYLQPVAQKRDDRLEIYRPDVWKAIEKTVKKESGDAE